MRREKPTYGYTSRGKDFNQILTNFGLQRHITADCRRVFKYVDKKAEEKACIPRNDAVTNFESHCPPPLVVC